ncbi:glycosyltransferase [Chachezhania sediminis]|uniref:glycosyltransferase n=1 Tax=Chachezhania sediminis TaxID=2599291 RepID=UPI00131CA398|nr:glycosyltransferase [Chachezhania sediminis]
MTEKGAQRRAGPEPVRVPRVARGSGLGPGFPGDIGWDHGLAPPRPPLTAPDKPLGRHLVESGDLSQSRLVAALHLQRRLSAALGEILVSENWTTPEAVQRALSHQYDLPRIDLNLTPPDPALAGLCPYTFWLRFGAIPWRRREDGVLLVALSQPDLFPRLSAALSDRLRGCAPVLSPAHQIEAATQEMFQVDMTLDAAARVPEAFSCRSWQDVAIWRRAGWLGLLALFVTLAPQAATVGFVHLSMLALVLFSGLRLTGLLGHLLDRSPGTAGLITSRPLALTERLPRVSMLVPLYKEAAIADTLIRRLSRLTYPKALLDVILVLEEGDTTTRQTIAGTDLPPWMRLVEVPGLGSLRTKPRAMNYALNLCRGDIVGVWDAEDAPSPDQIDLVVARFAKAPADTVCLQGILDFYNPRSNWMARCFTIEYASWFRIVLPGIARLGLVIPLGGTTFFIRRAALERLGGWDAHNVTEDADLGVRIARAGYRTEILHTVTYEEANCRLWPWIRQRSRWLKGFMVTYLVHMRGPMQLWRELGTLKFLGFQAFFLGTCGQFLLAPALWSCWAMVFGLWHPLTDVLSRGTVVTGVALTLGAEVLTITVGMIAALHANRRGLMGWAPTMFFYFPLATVAAYKALLELFWRPYFWDKTAHGKEKAQIVLD